jgi:hypothetical protein
LEKVPPRLQKTPEAERVQEKLQRRSQRQEAEPEPDLVE